MRRCSTCGGVYDHASNPICRGDQEPAWELVNHAADVCGDTAEAEQVAADENLVVDEQDRTYRDPTPLDVSDVRAAVDEALSDAPAGRTIAVSRAADELTDEQLVQLRGYINDVVQARTHWLIPFAGLLGKTSTQLIEDLGEACVRVHVLRLPDDVGVWLALVKKSDLSEAQLQDMIRQRWGWGDEELFNNLDASGDIIALPERAEWADEKPGLYTAVVTVVARVLREWCLTGKILQPRFEKALVVTLG